ncbi:uncharacterized protein HMPREF1541_00291 [Cyphellophora europaea CBS 101466]|uniref:Uncharacterized protein n=1 Tax=Cyphellophora europaea (strain CBS 101466) TaxID=1220924 RepID=W2SBM4_CYPE1|nr:uncharacterized protein HMPREF1541_00291 [Cyphellophora europaea CBS 101466]ETN46107.1 hypothetical protein HMPREF1541_00291 [Cyphellophora europaea CBS 101466]
MDSTRHMVVGSTECDCARHPSKGLVKSTHEYVCIVEASARNAVRENLPKLDKGSSIVFDMDKPEDWDEMDEEARWTSKRERLVSLFGGNNLWFEEDGDPLRGDSIITVWREDYYASFEAANHHDYDDHYWIGSQVLPALCTYTEEDYNKTPQGVFVRMQACREDRDAVWQKHVSSLLIAAITADLRSRRPALLPQTARDLLDYLNSPGHIISQDEADGLLRDLNKSHATGLVGVGSHDSTPDDPLSNHPTMTSNSATSTTTTAEDPRPTRSRGTIAAQYDVPVLRAPGRTLIPVERLQMPQIRPTVQQPTTSPSTRSPHHTQAGETTSASQLDSPNHVAGPVRNVPLRIRPKPYTTGRPGVQQQQSYSRPTVPTASSPLTQPLAFRQQMTGNDSSSLAFSLMSQPTEHITPVTATMPRLAPRITGINRTNGRATQPAEPADQSRNGRK